MKKPVLSLFIILLITITGCSKKEALSTDKVKIPYSSSHYKGESFQEVENNLKELGLTNIEYEIIYNLSSSSKKEGDVKQVALKDGSKLKKGAILDKDTKIIITYRLKDKDNPEYRTYKGVVYDKALYSSEKDGLRAKVEKYFIFSSEDHVVISGGHSTAGGGRTTKLFGTYKGNFDSDIIEITYNNGNSTTLNRIDHNGESYWKEGYSALKDVDVRSSLNTVSKWK